MKRGRRTKLSLELQHRLVEQLLLGVPLEYAAHQVGIARPTLFRWLARGRSEDSGLYQDFARAVNEARQKRAS